MMTKQNSLLSPLDKIKLNYKPNSALSLGMFMTTLCPVTSYAKLFAGRQSWGKGDPPPTFWKYTH